MIYPECSREIRRHGKYRGEIRDMEDRVRKINIQERRNIETIFQEIMVPGRHQFIDLGISQNSEKRVKGQGRRKRKKKEEVRKKKKEKKVTEYHI